MQEGVTEKVARRAQWLVLAQEIRRADGQDFFRQQALLVQGHVPTGAIADAEVGGPGRQIDALRCGRDPDFQFRVDLLEAVEARSQPLAGEGRGDGDRKRPSLHGLSHQCDGPLEGFKGVRSHVGSGPPGFGQLETAPFAQEKRGADMLLQGANLLGDRTRRDGQFIGRTGETFQPGGGLEGAQGVQRRKTRGSGHGFSLDFLI